VNIGYIRSKQALLVSLAQVSLLVREGATKNTKASCKEGLMRILLIYY
jgi:hypothetical protein